MNDLGADANRGWYSRGRLPHYDGGAIYQFITIRLFDSLPRAVLKRLEAELALEPVEDLDRKRLILIDKFLDKGIGACFLSDPRVAKMVEAALMHHDGSMYDLVSWVIMPNHAHILIKPLPGVMLSECMHSIKSFTSHEANKLLGRTGSFWMREYFDRFIRDAEHFARTVRYIEQNPVKAGLADSAVDWPFGSARHAAGSVDTDRSRS